MKTILALFLACVITIAGSTASEEIIGLDSERVEGEFTRHVVIKKILKPRPFLLNQLFLFFHKINGTKIGSVTSLNLSCLR